MEPVVEWAHLTWPEAEAAVRTMPACVLPFGVVEEHGPHLPLETDTLLATEVCRRICERTGAILMPSVPYGQAWSTYRFPGTLSISIDTLIAFTIDLVRSLRDHGFKLVLIHSGHLGNMVGLREGIRRCDAELSGVKVVLLDRLAAALTEVKPVLTTPRSHPYYMHSCEIETSMLLAVSPEQVHMDRAVREYPEYPFDFDATPTRWDIVTKSGVLGDATAATPDKGKAIVGALVEQCVAIAEREVRELCR
jgi:creatinine amidohydrolase